MPRRVSVSRGGAGGAVQVRVEGLTELQRDLKKSAPDTHKRLRSRLRDAARLVANDARGRVDSVSGAAAKSIGYGATNKGSYVKGGKDAVPYYGWLDFGSRRPVIGNSRTVGPWARSGRGPAEGRFLYPAIEDNSTEVEKLTKRAVDEALKENRL